MKLRKDITLFIAATLFIVGFFLLPRNRQWLNKKVIPYYYDFQWQKNRMDIEARKIKRYGNSYTFSKDIADYLKQKSSTQNDLVLIPPAAYFKKHRIDYNVPEPAVFYYYTGLKTIWVKSEKAITANWYVHVVNGKIQVDAVKNIQVFSDSIKVFNKFPVPL